MKSEMEIYLLKHYNKFISECEFEVKIEPGIIQFVNNKCIIRFMMDTGYAACDLIDPIEKRYKDRSAENHGLPIGFPIYSSYSVWKFLYPNDTEKFEKQGKDLEEQILVDKRLLTERLYHIVKGDFSWTKAYSANDDRISRKIEYMFTHWPIDNPIRIKFREGDPSWEKEFDTYKKEWDRL